MNRLSKITHNITSAMSLNKNHPISEKISSTEYECFIQLKNGKPHFFIKNKDKGEIKTKNGINPELTKEVKAYFDVYYEHIPVTDDIDIDNGTAYEHTMQIDPESIQIKDIAIEGYKGKVEFNSSLKEEIKEYFVD